MDADRVLPRRRMLQAGGALTVAGLTGCADAAGPATPTPGTPTPSPAPSSRTVPPARAADWTAFGRGLDGRLYRPGGSGFAGAHRLFDPRYDGIVPAGVVRAASVNDVREAVRFARRHGLRCVAKSGGHSYTGASTAEAGLMIDIGGLRGISYANGLVTVGAGAKLYDVHVAVDRYGRSLPTGTCPTVGVAGLTLGGGIGVHTRTYGLTSDRVVSMEVVTADGVLRPANPKQNPELFWALRGGGGGNLGIVTSIRFATVPGGRLGFFSLSWPESKAAAVVRGWQRWAGEAAPGYWANLHLDARADGSLAVRCAGVAVSGSARAAAAQLESMVGSRAESRRFSSRSHLQAVRYLGGGSTGPRTRFAAGSDVLRGPMDAATITALLGAVKSRARAGHSGSALLDPLGGAAATPAGTSCWPWRSALGIIQWYAPLTGAAGDQPARFWIATGHQAVAKASAGGYVNYLEPGRAVASYYGTSWNRLRAARHSYDPTGFFSTL